MENIDDLAKAVINGDYGNGAEREEKLGEQYYEIQNKVNEMLGNDFRYDIPEKKVEVKEPEKDVEKPVLSKYISELPVSEPVKGLSSKNPAVGDDVNSEFKPLDLNSTDNKAIDPKYQAPVIPKPMDMAGRVPKPTLPKRPSSVPGSQMLKEVGAKSDFEPKATLPKRPSSVPGSQMLKEVGAKSDFEPKATLPKSEPEVFRNPEPLPNDSKPNIPKPTDMAKKATEPAATIADLAVAGSGAGLSSANPNVFSGFDAFNEIGKQATLDSSALDKRLLDIKGPSSNEPTFGVNPNVNILTGESKSKLDSSALDKRLLDIKAPSSNEPTFGVNE